MRHRFRVLNQFFAVETSRAGEFLEARVFLLLPTDGYFRREQRKPILRLRGREEQDLLQQAVRETETWLRRQTSSQP